MRNDYFLATSDTKGTTRLLDCTSLNQAKAKATNHAKKHCKRGVEIMLFDADKNLLVTKTHATNAKWSSNGNEPIIDADLETDLAACEAALFAVEPLVLVTENCADLEVKILTSKPKAKAKSTKIGRPKKEPTQVMRVPVAIAHHLEQIVKDYRAGNWTPPEGERWQDSILKALED